MCIPGGQLSGAADDGATEAGGAAEVGGAGVRVAAWVAGAVLCEAELVGVHATVPASRAAPRVPVSRWFFKLAPLGCSGPARPQSRPAPRRAGPCAGGGRARVPENVAVACTAAQDVGVESRTSA